MLKQIGVEPHYFPEISRNEILDKIENFEILFIRSKTIVDKELLQKAKSLKIVGRAGAGIDNLDMERIEQNGVIAINAPEGNRDAVAEHTMGLMLSLLHNINKSHIEITHKKWDREGNRGTELSSKTVGIIGYGNMGKALIKRLKSFRCKVLVFDKYIKDYEYGHQQKASLTEIQDQCDVISLHIPLTPETKGFVNDEFISAFRNDIYLINTARGEVVENEAIVNQLKSGKLLGAALDVLENEKIESLNGGELGTFEFLISSDKVILTPHVAGWSKESYYKINKVLVDKLEEKLKKLFLQS